VFNVFGLNDGDAGENWIDGNGGEDNSPADEITSANAPGADRRGGADPQRTTLLGTFYVENTIEHVYNNKKNGVAFSSPELLQFIQKDTNKLVTFIITRQSVSQTRITCFGTKENKDGFAPELKLSAEPLPMRRCPNRRRDWRRQSPPRRPKPPGKAPRPGPRPRNPAPRQ